MDKRRILVTAALPYVNGPIHLGYLVEAVQADIWARFQRMRGHDCIYIGADDAHGTATMIYAKQVGESEEDLIARMNVEHKRDLSAFSVQHDHYGTTHTEEGRETAETFWAKLREADMVVERDVTQLFDPEVGLFLADRFVRGTCPKCGALDQAGDNCAKCGSTYEPTDLKDPKSIYSDATPVLKTARHYFVRIEQLRPFLEEWIGSGGIQQSAVNYLKGQFLGDELRDWDVSRPAPYFGFEIPDAPGNYWYVWYDAPMGYISNTKIWCDENGGTFSDWWQDPNTEIRHFIGKDVVYFHCLFWPALLKTVGYTLPNRVQIHGMLTVDGQKMAKRDGTFIEASVFAKHVQPELLRYFYASKLSSKMDDFDFSPDEFVAKVNSDLVGKVVNLASRTARFIKDIGCSASYPEDGGLFAKGVSLGDKIAAAYEACEYHLAIRKIMELADAANTFVEEKEPWALKKDPARVSEMQDVCTTALSVFRQIMVYLAPVLPELVAKAEELLGVSVSKWVDAASPLVGIKIAPFKHLLKRVDSAQIEAMMAEQRGRATEAQ